MRKEITSQFRLSEFKSTPCYRQLVEFIQSLAEAVAGKALTDECLVSPAVQCVLDDLQQMSEWVAEIPPMQQAMRYGNKAFIAWYKKLCGVSKGMAAKLLEARNAAPAAGLSVEQAGAELAVYLTESFGNATRIDYGTGHELAFAAFLCGGERIGCFTADDRPALVLRVFDKYLSLMRLLQTTYWLEPAGSHGVWGLDDYQHLCFFFGAAQLSLQREIAPAAQLVGTRGLSSDTAPSARVQAWRGLSSPPRRAPDSGSCPFLTRPPGGRARRADSRGRARPVDVPRGGALHPAGQEGAVPRALAVPQRHLGRRHVAEDRRRPACAGEAL